jgi:hypothetical protein
VCYVETIPYLCFFSHRHTRNKCFYIIFRSGCGNFLHQSQRRFKCGTSALPFNSWKSVSFKPGNTYLQKAGTTSSDLLALFRSKAHHPCLSSSIVMALALPRPSQMLFYLIILHISSFRILPSSRSNLSQHNPPKRQRS